MGEVVKHDMLLTRWGHNFNVIEWDEKYAILWVWSTPVINVGDIILSMGFKDVIRMEVVTSEQQRDPSDMYKVTVRPEGSSWTPPSLSKSPSL